MEFKLNFLENSSKIILCFLNLFVRLKTLAGSLAFGLLDWFVTPRTNNQSIQLRVSK